MSARTRRKVPPSPSSVSTCGEPDMMETLSYIRNDGSNAYLFLFPSIQANAHLYAVCFLVSWFYARVQPTQPGAFDKSSYSSSCCGCQLQSIKSLSSAPISDRHNIICLQRISGRQQLSSQLHVGGQYATSSWISTM